MRLILGLFLALLAAPVAAGTIYIDTGGATTNSGTSDNNTAKVGGTSTITCSATTYTGSTPGCSISGTPDLSAVIATPGATQDAIYLTCATNTNAEVHWITAVDDGADLVQTQTTVTGCTASSSVWSIGGRMVFTLANFSAALRPGDTVLFNNSPAAQSATFITAAVSGDSTSGHIKWIGKTGVRPVLNATSTNAAIVTTSIHYQWFENLEIDQDGATGAGITLGGNNAVVYNVKVSDAGSGSGIAASSSVGQRIINSEVSGSAAAGIILTSGSLGNVVSGNYIHDNTTEGLSITATAPGFTILNNIIDSNAGRGIYISGAVTTNTSGVQISGNTVYGNGNSGLEVTDADVSVSLTNNIFQDNGDAAGEYNVEWVAGTAEISGSHNYNIFYDNGAGENLLNLTVNATEAITDPLLAAPSTGNFALGTSSPAIDTGFPGQMLGVTSLGYRDMGAQEKQGASAGGGFIIGGS